MKRFRMAAFVLLAGLCVSCEGKKDDAPTPTKTAPHKSTADTASADQDELMKLTRDLKSQGEQLKTDLKRKADATPPSALAIASYANIMAEEGQDSEAQEYLARLNKLNPESQVAAALKQFLAEKAGVSDKQALQQIRLAHAKRYFAAVQADAESAMTTDQRLALATFGEASKQGDNAVMEAAQRINDAQVAELKKRYDVCQGVTFDLNDKGFQENLDLQTQLFDLERKKGQDGVMEALPKLLEQHPRSAAIYSAYLRHRLDRDEFVEAQALVKKARAALPDVVEFRIIEDSLDEITKAPSSEAVQARKMKLTSTLLTLAGAQIDCMQPTK